MHVPSELCCFQLGSVTWLETMAILFQKFAPADNCDVETQMHKSIRVKNKKYVNMNLEPDVTIEEVDAVKNKKQEITWSGSAKS